MNNLVNVTEEKRKLEKILSREEFASYHQKKGDNPLADWLERFFDWLASRLEMPEIPHGSGNIASYLIIAGALVALLLLIIWLSRQTIRSQKQKRLLPAGAEESSAYTDYLLQAKQFGENGNWNEGIRYAFLALLFFLEEKEWIKVEKWKTNWEYLGELFDNSPEWAPFFRQQALLFEHVWYGRRSIDEQGFREYIKETEMKLNRGAKDDRTT
jgi:hypothetical protein